MYRFASTTSAGTEHSPLRVISEYRRIGWRRSSRRVGSTRHHAPVAQTLRTRRRSGARSSGRERRIHSRSRSGRGNRRSIVVVRQAGAVPNGSGDRVSGGPMPVSSLGTVGHLPEVHVVAKGSGAALPAARGTHGAKVVQHLLKCRLRQTRRPYRSRTKAPRPTLLRAGPWPAMEQLARFFKGHDFDEIARNGVVSAYNLVLFSSAQLGRRALNAFRPPRNPRGICMRRDGDLGEGSARAIARAPRLRTILTLRYGQRIGDTTCGARLLGCSRSYTRPVRGAQGGLLTVVGLARVGEAHRRLCCGDGGGCGELEDRTGASAKSVDGDATLRARWGCRR